MNAILFPGQGSQIVGMGQEFYNNFDLVKKIFDQADEKLNFKISKLILEGPESDLKLTQNTQPAILTVSYSIFNVLKNEFNFNFENTKYFAGHSLGEYSALVCSDSLAFKDALYLLFERGKSMQEAVPVGQGSMIAVLGSKIDDLSKLIKDAQVNGVCEIANDNAEGQTIISGDTESMNSLQKILKSRKKKFIPLNVSAPFHCSLMKPAAESMKILLKNIIFKNPSSQLISNVTALPIKEDTDVKDLLYKQIFSQVRWRESVEYMINNNVNDFVEIGPGKVLSGLIKRTNDKVLARSITKIEDLENIK